MYRLMQMHKCKFNQIGSYNFITPPILKHKNKSRRKLQYVKTVHQTLVLTFAAFHDMTHRTANAISRTPTCIPIQTTTRKYSHGSIHTLRCSDRVKYSQWRASECMAAVDLRVNESREAGATRRAAAWLK